MCPEQGTSLMMSMPECGCGPAGLVSTVSWLAGTMMLQLLHARAAHAGAPALAPKHCSCQTLPLGSCHACGSSDCTMWLGLRLRGNRDWQGWLQVPKQRLSCHTWGLRCSTRTTSLSWCRAIWQPLPWLIPPNQVSLCSPHIAAWLTSCTALMRKPLQMARQPCLGMHHVLCWVYIGEGRRALCASPCCIRADMEPARLPICWRHARTLSRQS